MAHISIILVDYNAHDWTKECLASLVDITGKSFDHQIVVVDNGSQQPLKLTKAQHKKNIDLIRSESNLGFSGGNNLGITHAIEQYDSEYILLLNNDTTVTPDFLEKLYACLEDYGQPAMVSPKIYFSKGREFHLDSYDKKELGSVLWYAGGTVDWAHLEAFHRGVDEVDRGQFDGQRQTDFVTGACVLISREVLERSGLLDEKLFLYYEDTELSLRAQAAGFGLLLCPEAVIWHANAGSSGGSGSRLQQYYQERNRIHLALQFAPWRYKLTALRYALSKIVSGNGVQRLAAFHALTRNLGKQPVI